MGNDMPSHDFEQFYESCFGDDSFAASREGVDQQAVLRLQGEERNEAERLLLQALGTAKDTYSRPVVALGLLHSRQAVEPLKKRLLSATGTDRIQTALALFRIVEFPEAAQIVAESLRVSDTNKPDKATRLLAIAVLPSFGPKPEVVEALIEAMAETDVVGYSATSALRTIFIDDEPIRNLLAQIMLIRHDANRPDFVSRPSLVKQAAELIGTRLSKKTAKSA
jgi:HEAT repeat protein